MSRRSVLSMRASGLLDPVLPLRGYFLAVGGALLLLLLAADWVLPAPRPGRFDESNSTLPPIRIHSDVNRPEAVSIDTNQSLPAHIDEAVMAASQPSNNLDAPDAAQAGAPAPLDPDGHRSVAALTAQARDSLAQSIPNRVAGMAHNTPAPKPGQKSSRVRDAQRSPPARPSKPGGCSEASGRCGDAFAFFRPY